jgi:hypothetical protein
MYLQCSIHSHTHTHTHNQNDYIRTPVLLYTAHRVGMYIQSPRAPNVRIPLNKMNPTEGHMFVDITTEVSNLSPDKAHSNEEFLAQYFMWSLPHTKAVK